jgi:hypothetical protein
MVESRTCTYNCLVGNTALCVSLIRVENTFVDKDNTTNVCNQSATKSCVIKVILLDLDQSDTRINLVLQICLCYQTLLVYNLDRNMTFD